MAWRYGRFLVPLIAVAPLACGMVVGLSGYELAPNDSSVDTSLPDTTVADTNDATVDSSLPDTHDATLVDAVDAVEADTLDAVDSGPEIVVDTNVDSPDTLVIDSGVDTFVPDMFVPDTFVPDTFVPDTFVADTAKSDSVGLACDGSPTSCGESTCCIAGPCTGICVHNCNITKMCMPGDVCCGPSMGPCSNTCVKHCSTGGCPGGGTCSADSGLCF